METKKRSGLIPGAILVLVGLALLVFEFVPEFHIWFNIVDAWPLIVVGVGLFLAIIGFAESEPGMAVPATIVSGIGLLLLYQNISGDWGSWAYAWSLIPGFVGLGIILMALFGSRQAKDYQAGGILLLISVALFMIFGAFLGPFDFLGNLWPILIIAVGVIILITSLRRR